MGRKKMKPFLLLLLILQPFGPASEGILEQAIQLFGEGEYREANELLLSGDGTSKVSAQTRFWLGKTWLRLHEWDKAVKEMEKAVKMEPSNAMYHLWLGRAYGDRAQNRIFGYNDARRVIREFRKAGELEPESIDIRFDLLEYYAQAPGIVGGDKKKAWAEAEAISKLSPVRGYTARATIYEHEKEWDMAETEYTRATIEFPSDVAARNDLAEFYFGRKDFKRALASARKALELDVLSKPSRYILAVSLIQLEQDLDKAGDILVDLTSEPLGDGSPSFEDAYYWLGICYYRRGEKDKSKNAFESALGYNPDYGKAKDYLSKMK